MNWTNKKLRIKNISNPFQLPFGETLIFSMVLMLCACNHDASPKTLTVPVENITPTADQYQRRLQSEKYCKAHTIPIYSNPNALFVDPEDSVRLRTKDEVVDRALALCFLGVKSEGLDKKDLDKIESRFHIVSKPTLEEKKYVNALVPSKQQIIDANWKYECYHVMLWALHFVDTLSYPDTTCNVASDVKIIRGLTEAQFRAKAKLRTKKEILDQADLILRLDWACVNARLDKQRMPGRLNSDVVVERHRALNWLIRFLDEENWDDVTTDT